MPELAVICDEPGDRLFERGVVERRPGFSMILIEGPDGCSATSSAERLTTRSQAAKRMGATRPN